MIDALSPLFHKSLRTLKHAHCLIELLVNKKFGDVTKRFFVFVMF